MLKQVLHAIETADRPMHLGELSLKLGVERSALSAMIQYWVRKGRLADSALSGQADSIPCGGSCHDACSGGDVCSFVVQMPPTFTLRAQE